MTSPERIGKYQVVDRLGQGGMGALYLARDPAIERLVAIKLLREDFDNPELRQRFAREARAAGRLRHANLVTIYDYGEQDGQPFIVMEYIDGETFAEQIRRRARISLARKLELIEELCAGLAYAHRTGIVHRDIKPANVMVDTHGRLKIVDFGIAQLGGSSMTRVGSLVGTLNYMSPEQVQGIRVDHRSDIFAVGLVFYEWLTYQRAFTGDTQATILHRILQEFPQPLLEVCPGLDPQIERIILRAIAKEPAARYKDLEVMRREIGAVRQRSQTAHAPPTSVPGIHPPAASPTPSTPRRLEIEKRRADQIRAHIEAAQRAFDAARFEDVLDQCEEALLLDVDNREAQDLAERARLVLDEVAAAHRFSRDRFQTPAPLPTTPAPAGPPPTPTPIRLEREQAELKRALARDAAERAQKRFSEGAFESAIRAAEEALAHDASLSDAERVRSDARAALDERRQQAELEQESREKIADARRLFGAGNIDLAVKLLEGAKPHPLIGQEIDVLRMALRIREDERAAAEADRQKREQEEQARQARERAAAENGARRAPALSETRSAPEDRRRVEQTFAAASQLYERKDLVAALERTEETLFLDAGYGPAKQLRAEIQRAMQQQAGGRPRPATRPSVERTWRIPVPPPPPKRGPASMMRRAASSAYEQDESSFDPLHLVKRHAALIGLAFLAIVIVMVVRGAWFRGGPAQSTSTPGVSETPLSQPETGPGRDGQASSGDTAGKDTTAPMPVVNPPPLTPEVEASHEAVKPEVEQPRVTEPPEEPAKAGRIRTLLDRASAAMRQERHDVAAAEARAALALDGSSREAQRVLADAEQKQRAEQARVAEEEAQKARQAEEQQRQAAARAEQAAGQIATADARFTKGDYDGALAAYDDALKLDPANGIAQAGIAKVKRTKAAEEQVLGDEALKRGAYDQAIAAYQNALKLDPSNARARTGLERARQTKVREEEILKKLKPPK